MINYTLYDEDPHIEIEDIVHGYSLVVVKASKYCIIIYIFGVASDINVKTPVCSNATPKSHKMQGNFAHKLTIVLACNIVLFLFT